ncbi:MAG: esterase-like activity of phytase family protein [Verrucomicrobia bacterium]|nr:esterase-like activity of phytase family protein [Verrucomicrobiota bacterium]
MSFFRLPTILVTGLAVGAIGAVPARGQTATLGGVTFTNQGLVGVGRVPASQRDRLNETFGSLSGLALDVRTWRRSPDGTYSGTLYSQPDRGYVKSGVTTNYRPRLHQLAFTFAPAPAGSTSQTQARFSLNDTVLFAEANGTPLTSLDPSPTVSGVRTGFPPLPQAYNGRLSLDAEGLARLPDGTFFVSDEYGPYLHRFSAAGVLLQSIRPPEAFVPKRNTRDSFSSDNPAKDQPSPSPSEPAVGRENNQGFEGLTLSPDGTTLYALMQSALRQDGGEDGNSLRRYTRLVGYDISNPAAPVLRSEWILPLPLYLDGTTQQVASVGDFVALNGRQFLVLVRDGIGRGADRTASQYRRVLVYDVAGATNLAGSTFDNPNFPAAPKGVLAGSIVPATSTVLIDLNDSAQLSKFGLNNGPSDNSNTLSEKWESLALAPTLDPAAPDDFFLLVGNDNDYSTTDGRQDGDNYRADLNIDTMVLVYRLTLPGTGTATAPAILTQPGSLHVSTGGAASFSVVANAGGGALTYQWKRSGEAIPGATLSLLALTNVRAADMGFYTVSVTSRVGTIESTPAILTVATGTTSRLANVSTRGLVRAGEALTPGFVLKGNGTKSLLIRAIGPTLGAFGVAGALADPRLEVIRFGESSPFTANDDWVVGQALRDAFAAVGAFALPSTGSKDAALLASVSSTGGTGYTVRITATSASATGIALAEVYDTESPSTPVRLANVSTLGFAGIGAEGLTPGFVIDGTAPKLVLIRVVGPGLAAFGVTGALADPQLAVVPLGFPQVIASNNDWGDGGQAVALQSAFSAAAAFALPSGSKDAAVLLRLPPGGFTVQASGANASTGTALVEVYDLDP